MNRLKKVLRIGLPAIMILVASAALAAGSVKLVKGQTVYIPSYSNILSNIQNIALQANLIIHNTDPVKAITLVRIDHYDTHGKLVKKYLQKPVKLEALAAYPVAIKESKGDAEGAGANFIVQWNSEHKVTEPLIECVMLGTVYSQGYAFTSQGRVIQEDSD